MRRCVSGCKALLRMHTLSGCMWSMGEELRFHADRDQTMRIPHGDQEKSKGKSSCCLLGFVSQVNVAVMIIEIDTLHSFPLSVIRHQPPC